MTRFLYRFTVVGFACFCLIGQLHAQPYADDSPNRPYFVNYGVTGTICGVGLVANYLGITEVLGKKEISSAELQALNKNVINGIDSWALNLSPSHVDAYENYSTYTVAVSCALPGLLLFDKQIKRDWSDMLLMYMETMTITTNIFEWSPLGPTFQNKFRPITYYVQLPKDQRNSGSYRNSLYSGHVAAVSAATFFMAKVYSDYNPAIGKNKYLIYAAALAPPLFLSYLRVAGLKHFPSDVMVGMGVGALVGIIVPELHRQQGRGVSLGLFSSPEGSGIALAWHPMFLEQN
jgi:membrane-associated phospholipid phosphatase